VFVVLVPLKSLFDCTSLLVLFLMVVNSEYINFSVLFWWACQLSKG